VRDLETSSFVVNQCIVSILETCSQDDQYKPSSAGNQTSHGLGRSKGEPE
jgi:hypothetical protein